jgi:transcription elongation GreA/GreB family factor
MWLPDPGSPSRFALKHKECAVLPLPAIALTASDYPRLEKLARVAAQQGDMDAMSLLIEINRAEIIPDDAREVESIVTIGSWVTYWSNWGVPRKTVQLVWPEEHSGDLVQISVLSGLGAALLGLRVGDQMPYFVAGCMNVIRIESVSRSDANVVPLVRPAARTNDDPNPGPSAA